MNVCVEEVARLGRATAAPSDDHEKVRVLDVETDNGSRVVLTILRKGGLAVQVYTENVRVRSLYRLAGTVTLEAELIREWATTLGELLGVVPPRSRVRLAAGGLVHPSGEVPRC